MTVQEIAYLSTRNFVLYFRAHGHVQSQDKLLLYLTSDKLYLCTTYVFLQMQWRFLPHPSQIIVKYLHSY
jgi:hypothetical protein